MMLMGLSQTQLGGASPKEQLRGHLLELYLVEQKFKLLPQLD